MLMVTFPPCPWFVKITPKLAVYNDDTVDGSEIRRSPVDMVDFPLFTRLYASQVVQDFFHQQ